MKWVSQTQRQQLCSRYYRQLRTVKKRHSKEKKDGKSKGGARLSTVCLSMYSITENIYCSQLSSVAILL
jgi:hypothetical protein